MPLSCFVCWDALNEFSDLSFGDARMRQLNVVGGNGTSLVVARTKYSDRVLREAESAGAIRLDPVSEEEVIENPRRLMLALRSET